MDELKDKTVLVYDYGNYPETAMRLSREFGRVLYFKPWKDTLPTTNRLVVGDGYEEIERVRNFFSVIKDVDLFVFPDIYDGDLQLFLESMGKRVWGSRMAEDYEYRRGLFIKTCEEVGLDVPNYKKCVGIDALEKHLKENDDQWIKVELRGDRETWHHINWEMSSSIRQAIRYQYGPLGDQVLFWSFDGIPSTVEAAYDGYMVSSPDGDPQFPKAAFLGYEDKNMAHILSVVDYDDLSEPVLAVNEAFGPKLSERGLRSQWGTEIKILEDGSFYFLDATCRQPSPPGEIVLELVENLGEIMWHGSVGELVEAKTSAKFGVQVSLYSSWSSVNYLPIQIPEDLRQWVKLSDCFKKDGMDWIIPPEAKDPLGGWRKHFGDVVALGDTIEEAIDLVKERCDQIEGFDTESQISSLAECLSRIKKGEEEGIEFTDQEVPEPATVIEE